MCLNRLFFKEKFWSWTNFTETYLSLNRAQKQWIWRFFNKKNCEVGPTSKKFFSLKTYLIWSCNFICNVFARSPRPSHNSDFGQFWFFQKSKKYNFFSKINILTLNLANFKKNSEIGNLSVKLCSNGRDNIFHSYSWK